MKRIKHLLTLACLTGLGLAHAQMLCDDFTVAPWPMSATFMEGDTVGLTQGATQPLIVGETGMAFFGPSDEGLYHFGPAHFEFDGSYQTARFEIYGFEGQFNEMGFAVNDSETDYMDADFPLELDGITIDMDDSAPDFESWTNVYLTFTGNLNEVTIYGFESGILSLCTEPAEESTDDCDDFTAAPWPMSATFMEGDTVGLTQGATQPLIVGETGMAFFGPSDEGLYHFGPAHFEFDGSYQTARFEIYGFEGQFNEMGFAVNDSETDYMDADFPLELDGITIDMDDSAPDFESWTNVYLTFTGNLDEVTIYGFESGILSLCTEPAEEPTDDCDDFTAFDWAFDSDTLGYTQGNTQPIVAIPYEGDEGPDFEWDLSIPSQGMYGITSGARFHFDGSDQIAQFEIYGWYGADTYNGVSVNGSATVPLTLDVESPLEGVTINLDTSGTILGGFWHGMLTLTGEISTVEIHCFEAGILGLCTLPNTTASLAETSPIQGSIYPNPANDQVTISHPQGIKQIQIYTMSGQRIREIATQPASTVQLEVDTLKPGIYLINLILENGTKDQQKLMIH